MNAIHSSKILLVEDDIDHANLLTRWLKQLDMEAVVTWNGSEGHDLAARDEFDVVISDANLPERDGMEIIGRSKALYPWRPALLITGESSFERALQALRGGADEMLTKPIGLESFGRTMTSLVERGRLMRTKNRRAVVAIGAHPDDVEIGCGGTLLRHRQQGDRVVVLTLTHGARGGDRHARADEARRAVKLLGAELALGDLNDTEVSGGAPTIKIIEEVLRAVDPSTVYTHTPNDTHQDHRAAYEATVVAARDVANVFSYQSPSSTTDFRPNRFVDVAALLPSKEALIACYATQTRKHPYLRTELVRATARYWGRFAGYGEVEALEIVRAID
jgi:LmbE family N-acetylglucosaminyl deacetylase